MVLVTTDVVLETLDVLLLVEVIFLRSALSDNDQLPDWDYPTNL